jgi:predicted enzyme related to lactoylglutathione lyase
MDAAESEVAEILDVIIDCSDPERLAAFWSEVLGRPIEGRKGPYVWLERRSDLGFGFQRVTESRRGKNRVHVDVGVADLVAAESRIEELGGRRAAGYERGGFLVMQDPEGNEFCLIPLAPFNFDDEGRADYLDGVNTNDR